jgi:hypothetical protein
MPTRLSKTSGVSRIAKAIRQQEVGLSIGCPVLYYNSYFSSYKPTELPKVKSSKEFHKTYCLIATKDHYINYSLRAAILALRQSSAQEHNCLTKFVTIQLGIDVSEKIRNGSKSKTPTVYFNERFRKRFLSKIEVKDYFFVLEESKNGCLHIHLVANFKDGNESKLKGMLTKANWLPLSASGMVKNSSVLVKDTYVLKMKRTCLTDEDRVRLDMEIDSVGFDSSWYCSKTALNVDGTKICTEYKTVDPVGIDVGLADYLSKSLTEKLFGTGNWNYSISRDLTAKVKPFRERLLSEGRS